ncbi:MAG: aromatic ring-hydroxylating oxygenase subunit alpha [Stellaceae bacterium]
MAVENRSRSGEPGGLPQSLAELGTALGAPDERDDIALPPALFADAEIFATERTRIFARSWIIADHLSRLDGDGRYFTLDTGLRPLVVTRESADRLHALGNLCLHAGYRVCEDEEGGGERLHCLYHDWEYALDGRLLYPALSPERYDPARLRLPEHTLAVESGLILVALSPTASPHPEEAADLPAWLAGAAVVARTRFSTERNWKHLHAALSAAAEPILGAPPIAPVLSFGALGLVIRGRDRAVVLRLIPKAVERTDVHLIRLSAARTGAGGDGADIAETAAAAPPPALSRRFLAWYWARLS